MLDQEIDFLYNHPEPIRRLWTKERATSMPVTLTEIAKAAGVSLSTASRALSKSAHPMNESTRDRILNIAQELGYQPNLVARSLRTDRTNTIGIIVENILSPFIPPIIRGIQDHLRPAGYFSTITNSDWDPTIEEESINALNNRQIDGIIFVETWHRSARAIREITEKPFVFVHRVYHDEYENSIRVDELFGSRLAVRHLIGLGHQRIAYINGPKEWDASKERLLGYMQELQANGITTNRRLIKEGDWEVNGGYRAAQKLLELPDRPTAIFAANDLMALGTIYAIQEAGLRVPEDIAVMGYDDRNFAGIVRPALTTISLPAYEMGETAARLMLSLLRQEISGVEKVEVRGKLIIRESCGAGVGQWVFEEEEGSKAWRSKRRRDTTFPKANRGRRPGPDTNRNN
jgi:LacI family transcriptional regulator